LIAEAVRGDRGRPGADGRERGAMKIEVRGEPEPELPAEREKLVAAVCDRR
jgi:hypothetical protein